MSFEWNVQPYRWLYELRDRYTQAVVATTRYHAFQARQEGEQWMRQNAPWQDRNIYRGRGENKRLIYPAGNARQNLRVEFNFGNEGQLAYRRGIQQVRRDTRHSGDTQSAIANFEKSFLKEQGLIVELLFRHGDERRVPYAVYLETANSGRYAIIARATEYWGRRLMNKIRSFMNLKQFRSATEGEIVSQVQQYEHYLQGGYTATGEPIRQEFSEAVRGTRQRRRSYRRRGPQVRGRYNV